jgi:RNA-binding protein
MNEAINSIPLLSPEQRRSLRAAAHHLKPVVSISQKGLQASVLAEIDRSLAAHELIKVRLYGIEREERAALETEVCSALACASVQQIGNLLVLWRQRPDSTAESTLAGRRPGTRTTKPMTKKQAASMVEGKAPKRTTLGKKRTPR